MNAQHRLKVSPKDTTQPILEVWRPGGWGALVAVAERPGGLGAPGFISVPLASPESKKAIRPMVAPAQPKENPQLSQ